MAVRIFPWMDGQIFAPAISALPPSLVVVFRKEPGMAVRLYPWMEWQITSPCVICTSCIHAGRMLKIVFVTWMSLSRAMQEQLPRNDFSVYPWITANTDGSPSTLFTAISSVYKNKIHRRPARRETAVGHNHTPHPSQPVFLSRPHHCRRYYSVLKISLSDADFHP